MINKQLNTILIYFCPLKYKYLLLGMLIFVSCNQTRQSTLAEPIQSESVIEGSYVHYPIKDNRIKVDLNKPQKASLFDYFSHIELIPLETNDDVLIGSHTEIIHYHGRFYVFDRRQYSVFVFDDTGKFIFQLNKRGRGPGEYTNIRGIFLNPFTNNIDILDIINLHSYDLSGKHVKTMSLLTNPIIAVLNFIALNEKTYVFWSPMIANSNSTSYKISYYDVEDEKIFHQEYEIDTFFDRGIVIGPTFLPSRFYEYNGKWFFSHLVDNVTYEADVDSLKKAYTWDFGRLNYNHKKLNLPVIESSNLLSLPYMIRLQGQNNRYVMAHIGLRDNIPKNGAYLIHDKSTNECKMIERFTESVDFQPRKITNEYALSWCYHGDLENYVTEEILNETNRQIFNDLMNTEEEQNTIIIKYYFK